MTTLCDTWGGLATPLVKPRIGGPRCGDPTVGWQRFIVQDSREIRALHQARPNRRAGGRPGDARRPLALIPRDIDHDVLRSCKAPARPYHICISPLRDTRALMRLHGFLASRRARRLNLRPPGAG